MIDWVAIPAGPFPIGDDPARLYPPDEDETPRRVVPVEAFRIARLPVAGDDGLPLTYVSLAEAEAFCAANGVRLPTEDEWEAAARGGDDRLWPWGDELPDTTRATFGRGIGGLAAAGLHPAGAAPCGALDMAGTVYEWTASRETPGRRPEDVSRAPEGRPGDARETTAVVRGGSYLSGSDELRCAARLTVHPAARDPYIGFRVVAVDPRPGFDWCAVPAGEYAVGRDPGETRQRIVDVDAFELGRTPVTNAQYARFAAEVDAPAPPHRPAPDDHPVTFVDWADASAFCAWAGGRLPTEAEWEKAARGSDGRAWPWGDEPDESRAAIGAGIKHGGTSPVGSHPDGASPYGLLDMAGNVWEWTATEYPPGERVLRGGSFASPGLAWARCTMRSHSRPGRRQSHIGFRVARGGA